MYVCIYVYVFSRLGKTESVFKVLEQMTAEGFEPDPSMCAPLLNDALLMNDTEVCLYRRD